MQFTFHRLRREDIQTLKHLLAMFGEVFDEYDTYQNAIPSDAYLKSLLGENTFIALVAHDETKLIGGLVAYELRKFEQRRSELYLYDLAVLEQYRRKGVATGLIDYLKGIGSTIGAYTIFVQADEGDNVAIACYRSLAQEEIKAHHFDIYIP